MVFLAKPSIKLHGERYTTSYRVSQITMYIRHLLYLIQKMSDNKKNPILRFDRNANVKKVFFLKIICTTVCSNLICSFFVLLIVTRWKKFWGKGGHPVVVGAKIMGHKCLIEKWSNLLFRKYVGDFWGPVGDSIIDLEPWGVKQGRRDPNKLPGPVLQNW